MFTSMCAMVTAAIEHNRHIGTTRITANGSDQLSYWAASTRNTSTTANSKTPKAVLPVCNCNNPNSVHSCRIDHSGCSTTISSISSIAWPELTPGPGVNVIGAAGYML